jgi:exodeoxyribonuclease (lambda-induced)
MTDSDIIWHDDPQGAEAWLAARRGVITGSMFKVARDKLRNGEPSSKAMLYARDLARERCGGRAADVYVNAAMRFGSEQEPLARMAYEDTTGDLVEQVGFAVTHDGKFGASVDGLVDDDGKVENKTIVSSDTLFKAIVDGDHSEYIDQIDGCMWLLNLRWCDLCLWAPDLPEHKLTVVRIERDEARIEALTSDLLAFDKLVCELEDRLRAAMRGAR